MLARIKKLDLYQESLPRFIYMSPVPIAVWQPQVDLTPEKKRKLSPPPTHLPESPQEIDTRRIGKRRTRLKGPAFRNIGRLTQKAEN